MPRQMPAFASMLTRVVCARRRWSGTASPARGAPVAGSISSGASSPARERLRQRRAELGLPASDDARLLIDPATGAPLAADAVALHLRRAHTTRVSIEANAGICRGMLRHRYGTSGLGEEEQ
jgi:hypothetical protein